MNPINDCMGWAVGHRRRHGPRTRRIGKESPRALCERVRRPIFIIHGAHNALRPPGAGAALAELAVGSVVMVEGGGHAPDCIGPVTVDLLIKHFVEGTVK
jgi:pimeloyl-ACP methyl ester carboxylesterase